MSKPPTPRLAVIIPTFGHPVLLTEAVDSVLTQKVAFDIATIIVSDGCPMAETETVCMAYAHAYPNVIFLRQRNGGPSSARNAGIEFALSSWPQLEAIFFLDADNRLGPNALASAFTALSDAPENVGWIYTNVDSFGIRWSAHLTVPYSPLVHVAIGNVCDTGSLVSSRVFERGVRFDEDSRSGFEDWDFWLRCIEKGFLGQSHPFALAYRQRPESRNQEMMRNTTAIVTHMKTQHKTLSSPQRLLLWEHTTNPRYLYGTTDGFEPVYDSFTDPGEPGTPLAAGALTEMFWSHVHAPDEYLCPPFLAWGLPALRDVLTHAKLLHNVFFLMERCARAHNFAALRICKSSNCISVDVERHDASGHRELDQVVMWMCSAKIGKEVALDPQTDWVMSLQTKTPMPTVGLITLSAPGLSELAQASSSALNSMLTGFDLLRSSSYRSISRSRWHWRPQRLPGRDEYYGAICNHLGVDALTPRLSKSALNIGLVVPFASYGGAEKVAYCLAKVLAQRGILVHLFVVGEPRMAVIDEFHSAFSSINFLADRSFPIWGGPTSVFGQPTFVPTSPEIPGKLVTGFLAGLDLVINCHSAPMNALMGQLRALGTKTATYLHVTDVSPLGRLVGHSYLTVSFEHAYDLVMTCSNSLARDLHSLGVPQDKILPIPNAASFAVPVELAASLGAERARPRSGRNLRVLYMGRLDRQKGVDRLFSLFSALRRASSPVDIRVIGSALLDGQENWLEQFASIGITVESPVYDTKVLTQCYLWADILVLPSRWEGAPLVIPECQQLGCIPIAARVGAVEELIDHVTNGILIDASCDEQLVTDFVDWVQLIGTNDGLRRTLAEQAVSRSKAVSWERSFNPFIDWVQRKCHPVPSPKEHAADRNARVQHDHCTAPATTKRMTQTPKIARVTP